MKFTEADVSLPTSHLPLLPTSHRLSPVCVSLPHTPCVRDTQGGEVRLSHDGGLDAHRQPTPTARSADVLNVRFAAISRRRHGLPEVREITQSGYWLAEEPSPGKI
jgi:hypothetical protein